MAEQTNQNAVVIADSPALTRGDGVLRWIEVGDGLANVEEEAIRRLFGIPVLYKAR
jgi:hypothetical protein